MGATRTCDPSDITCQVHDLLRLTCHSAVMQGRCDAQVQLVLDDVGQEARLAPCCCCASGVMLASAQGVACNSGAAHGG